VSTPGVPPVQRLHLATTVEDEGVELMRAEYADWRSPQFFGGTDEYRFEIDSQIADSSAGKVRIDRTSHSMHVIAPGVQRLDRLNILVPLSGRTRYVCGRSEASPVCLCPTWADFDVEFDDFRLLIAGLEIADVQRVGADFYGIDPAAVVFMGMAPVSKGAATYLTNVVRHVEQSMLSDEVMASPLVRGELFRGLAAAVLAGFPNTTHTIGRSSRSDGGQPATVRRAVEFMDARAQDDIGISQIAAAARIGPRGLQEAFRKHRGMSPLTYLRRVRMEGAHRELRDADPTRGDTVTAIAARWGFRHAGRFAAEYLQMYGCAPSETLRR
jgi:AraC-like DNA-binding protein